MEKMFTKIAMEKELLKYLPDKSSKKLPNKEYFWSILFALRLEFVSELLDECLTHRLAIQQQKPKDDLMVSTEWVDSLLKFPMLPSNISLIKYPFICSIGHKSHKVSLAVSHQYKPRVMNKKPMFEP